VQGPLPGARDARSSGDDTSDERWSDIEADTAAAVDHFSRAIQIYQGPGLHDDSMDGYTRRMGFMHAMLAGHTSLEKALLRVLQLQGGRGTQRAPMARRSDSARGSDHTDIRPAILPAKLVRAIDRTRKFRHVAVRAYVTVDPDDADPAVRAAEKVAVGFAAAIAAYRQAVDPPA
jgi:hypothetical protein